MTATLITPDIKQAADTMLAVRDEVRGALVEREEESNLLTLSTIAMTHLLFAGEAGVAKSLTVRSFMSHIANAVYFERLLAKDSVSDEVLGPVSFAALENEKFERVVDGKLPTSNMAFLDEVFKANSTILNALLSIINERIFHNDGQILDVPLWSLVGASNELPGHDRPELRAFRDRFAACKIVTKVKTDDGFKSVVRGAVDRRANEGQTPATFTMIDADDIKALQDAAKQVAVPEDVLDDLAKLRRRAATEKQLQISDRRFIEGVKLMQAQAILNGRESVIPDDIALFQHILWNDPDDAPHAYELTLDFAGMVAKKVAKFREQFDPLKAKVNDLKTQVPTDGSPPSREVATDVAQVNMELKSIQGRLQKAIEDAEADKRDASALKGIMDEVEECHRQVKDDILGW